MKINCIFLNLCLGFNLLSFCQDAPVDAYQDSLQSIIDSDVSKSVKKESLFLLGEYLVQRDPDKA
jgi:hypothetical protein